ncbi:MAG TPA: formyltransferase family protein, partial [Fimbriimonas sp.]|nr:formyltransferase family protein [Fimbriimonas sp.]
MLDRVAIMVGTKGRGSNMLALIHGCKEGRVLAEVSVVIAPSAEAPALTTAQEAGIRTVVVEPGDNYGPRLLAALSGANWICLAGFMRLLPNEVLDVFPNRVLNIHPALLPKFGGKGMYGRRVHEAVLAAGETESGCTIHLVTPV